MANVAEYMVQQLSAWGVQRIYGVVGDTFFPLMEAIARQQSLRFIPVRHEAAAGFMASAEAKLTGRLGVCLATSGPGIANLLNGLGDAYADRVPVLAITGQVELAKLGTEAKQYVDQQSLIRPLATYTALVAHPEAIGQLLPTALRTAQGEGCVTHLTLPKDLFALDCQARVTPAEPFLGARPVPDPATIAGAVQLMASAQRPLLLVGQGARPAADLIGELADRWGAGIIQSLPAKGLVPGEHPLALGGLGEGGSDASHRALQEADLLLAIGCNWWPKRFVPEHLGVIKLDGKATHIGGRMPVSYGIAGEAGAVLPQLLAALGPTEREGWRARLGALKQEWESQVDRESGPGEPPLSPQYLVRALEQAVPIDAIITLDTGDHTVWFNRIFGGQHHEVLLSGNWRSLGFGLPAALAAKLVYPERTVVALVGDSGLQSLLGELATGTELGLPVVLVVVDNGMMAIEHNRAAARGLSTLGTTPTNPDFVRLAEACGWQAIAVRTAEELADAFPRALSAGGPFLLSVSVSAPVAPTINS